MKLRNLSKDEMESTQDTQMQCNNRGTLIMPKYI